MPNLERSPLIFQQQFASTSTRKELIWVVGNSTLTNRSSCEHLKARMHGMAAA